MSTPATEAYVNSYVQNELSTVNEAVDASWTLLCGILVFVMQLGFGLVEAGSIKSINTQTILLKNLLDVSIVTIGWWAIGYSLSSEGGNSFAGGSARSFFSLANSDWVGLYFNWAFSAAAATIVSGAVAGRIRFAPYIVTSATIGTIIFPIVSHWAWATNGWLYDLGFIDFAGGAVIHITGGTAALVAALTVGPRQRRFEWDPEEGGIIDTKPKGHSIVLVFIGTMLLWFGWYGFNGGSTLGVSDGRYVVAVTAMFNSSLASASSILSTLFIQQFVEGKLSLSGILNNSLAGLVAITPGCATQTSWGAFLTGIFSAVTAICGSKLFAYLRVDDPVDAVTVHGMCGFLGIVLTALFSNQELVHRAYGPEYISNYDHGHQLGVQIAGALAIFAFTSGLVSCILLPCKYFLPGGLRVTKADELVGTDYAHFSGYAYPDFQQQLRERREQVARKMEIARRVEEQKKSSKGNKKNSRGSREPKSRSSGENKVQNNIQSESPKSKGSDVTKDLDVHSPSGVELPEKPFNSCTQLKEQKLIRTGSKNQNEIHRAVGSPRGKTSVISISNGNEALHERLEITEAKYQDLQQKFNKLEIAMVNMIEKKLNLAFSRTSSKTGVSTSNVSRSVA